MYRFYIAILAFLLVLTFHNSLAQTDEFKSFSEDSVAVSDDEFKPFSEETVVSDSLKCAGCPTTICQNTKPTSLNYSWGSPLLITIIALCLTILAGIFVRFRATRNFRIPFLVVGIGFFGFYNGACPCMISSFENLVLLVRRVEVNWLNTLWFLGLIPITYIFGKVWCGWVCHLGALQEFLFKPKSKAWFRSERTAIILRRIRYSLLVALIVQLVIMDKFFWCSIDPFMAVFNIKLNYNYEWVSGILLVALVVTSIFSYRPFCRTVCPVGILLGWIAAIPGASIIGYKKLACTSCKSCNDSCDINAILRRKRVSFLDNKECIACGNCIDSCSNCGLDFQRKTKFNRVVLFLRRSSKHLKN